MSKHRMEEEVVEFRKFSALHLRRIHLHLDAWHTEWVMGEIPPDALDRQEYPFDLALEDLAANVDRAARLLEQVEYAEEHEPRHRAEGIWSGDSPRSRFMPKAELDFRKMVVAFEGHYHPDTDDYLRFPEGYDEQRVREVEQAAESVGVDLYKEALRVYREMGS